MNASKRERGAPCEAGDAPPATPRSSRTLTGEVKIMASMKSLIMRQFLHSDADIFYVWDIQQHRSA